MPPPKKLIAVIGGTGVQGFEVIKKLLSTGDDGTDSPYTVRVLTRDVNASRAKDLRSMGVETVEGSFMDFSAVATLFKGVYGAFVNTDGFVVGEKDEIHAGMRIFEIAKQAGIKHYVWSNLDYIFKKTGYDERYSVEHVNGKGRVGDWLKSQPSEENSMVWTSLTTGPYMDMFQFYMLGPLNKRDDGTFVFASPIGAGHMPLISLADIAFFARYIFDHPRETSAQDLEIASDIVSWPQVVEIFTEVTGQKAVYLPQPIEEWIDNFSNTHMPLAGQFHAEYLQGLHRDKTTWAHNFTKWWALWRDDVIKRDMDWIRKINPGTVDLATWMRRTGYTGEPGSFLKDVGDSPDTRMRPNLEKTRLL